LREIILILVAGAHAKFFVLHPSSQETQNSLFLEPPINCVSFYPPGICTTSLSGSFSQLITVIAKATVAISRGRLRIKWSLPNSNNDTPPGKIASDNSMFPSLGPYFRMGQ
jgi:hypothetical protein